MVLVDPADGPLIGRLLREGVAVGYIAVSKQQWTFRARKGIHANTWTESRLRYRLDLLTTWDEGFVSAEDEIALRAGFFQFKGEIWDYEELAGDERDVVFAQRFSKWQ